MRGDKTVEARPTWTAKRSERVYIYAGLKRSDEEEETRVAAEYGIKVDSLPRGVLIGTVEIVGCEPLEVRHGNAACFVVTRLTGGYAWLLSKPQRADTLRAPIGHPQPSFFTPF